MVKYISPIVIRGGLCIGVEEQDDAMSTACLQHGEVSSIVSTGHPVRHRHPTICGTCFYREGGCA